MATAYRHTEQVLRDNLDKLQAVSLRCPWPHACQELGCCHFPLTQPLTYPRKPHDQRAPSSSTESSIFPALLSLMSCTCQARASSFRTDRRTLPALGAHYQLVCSGSG